jgi:hypothetical protein
MAPAPGDPYLYLPRSWECSEREPADSLRDNSNAIGGWLPSLTFAFGLSMSTHQVTLNGQPIGVSFDQYKLLTMVRSYEHHDGHGKKTAAHELVMEGVDALGTDVTKFISPVPLKKGDVIQIQIG